MIKIVHFIYQLSTGGLENGLINLINNLSSSRYQHVIVCLTTKNHFSDRLTAQNVEIICLELEPGPLYRHYARLYWLLKRLKPDIVHTRNLNSIEIQMLSFAAGVKYRIHSEHGRGLADLNGTNLKHRIFRRFMSPFIHQFISLSREINQYLRVNVAIKEKKLKQIYNGVNLSQFKPGAHNQDSIKLITVGRMEPVKDPLTILDAIKQLIPKFPNIQLTVVGDGSMIEMIKSHAKFLNIENNVICVGERQDINILLAQSDIFVQTSLVEGISNTVLEAMASALPVVATDVGGNPELIETGVTGTLVPAKDVDSLVTALSYYCEDRNRRIEHGLNGRGRVEAKFSLQKMIDQYDKLYQRIA